MAISAHPSAADPVQRERGAMHQEEVHSQTLQPCILQIHSSSVQEEECGKSPVHEAGSPSAMKPTSTPVKILIVDDEQLIADTLSHILNKSGFAAKAVYSGDAALAAVPELCPDIVLTDVRMPGRNGIETGILIRQQCPQVRVVLFSGQSGISDLMQKALHEGYGFELWPKPIHPRELVRRLREVPAT